MITTQEAGNEYQALSFESRLRFVASVPSLFRLMLINTAKRHQPMNSEFPGQRA